jgi:tetratricopeptide (TPR) repeat protein
LGHHAAVNYAEFSPDGRWVITASDDGTARIWEVPTLTLSVPSWLADWAEAVAGQRIDERNASQLVPFDEVRRLRQTLAQVPDAEEAGRWAKWFYAENATRKISPASLLTVAQLVEQRIEQSTLDSLQQAVRLSPTNGVAQARLAYVTLTNEATPNPRLVASLEWQSRRGLELSPNEPDVWSARAQFCEHVGRLAEALAAMDHATDLNPATTNASFWNTRGLLLEKTNRLEEALQSYTKAIELSGPWKSQQTLPALAHHNRSKLNRRLNRLAEAGVDNLKARHLPQRDPGTPATHLDLSLFYNDETDEVPGREALAAEFDIRGWIQVSGHPADASLPQEVLNIRVAQKCRRLHFLHATAGVSQDGTEVGIYRLHYADGQQKEIPIIFGAHLRDLVPTKDSKETLARNTKVAWVGEMLDKRSVRYFETTWENERPDVAIESIDFVSRRTATLPTLMAITVEP